MDRILKQALSPERGPEARLNQSILKQAEEMTYMKRGRKKYPAVVLAACLTLAFGSITGLAAYKYFTPSQMAEEMNDDKLAEVFAGENAVLVNESQEFGDYKITFLGIVGGKDISKYMETEDGSLLDERMYIATAIERTDGTPMPDTGDEDYGKDPFFASLYIGGLNPNEYNCITMHGGYSEFVQNGVTYRMAETNNIEMFADRGIYFGVNSGTFYDSRAYNFNEATGEITRNEDFNGVNALFTVPIDKAKGDPAAAEAFLRELQAEWDAPEEPIEESESDLAVDDWMETLINMSQEKTLTKEFMDQYATVIESTVQVLKVEGNEVPYSYQVGEDGSGGSGTCFCEELFGKEPATGALGILGYMYSDGVTDLEVPTMTWNGDGTATFAVYRYKVPEQ